MQKFELALSNKDFVRVVTTDIESLMGDISKARSEEYNGYIVVSDSEDKKSYVNINHINMIIPLDEWE